MALCAYVYKQVRMGNLKIHKTGRKTIVKGEGCGGVA